MFYLGGLLIGFSFLVLLTEIAWSKCNKKRKTTFGTGLQKMYPSETKSTSNDVEKQFQRKEMYGKVQQPISKDDFNGFIERTISQESKKSEN